MKTATLTIEHSVEGHDTCEMQLYSRGHHDTPVFLDACREYFHQWDGRNEPCEATVRHIFWRNVPAPSDCMVADRSFIESRPGRGAFAVTILDEWYPIHIRKESEQPK